MRIAIVVLSLVFAGAAAVPAAATPTVPLAELALVAERSVPSSEVPFAGKNGGKNGGKGGSGAGVAAAGTGASPFIDLGIVRPASDDVVLVAVAIR